MINKINTIKICEGGTMDWYMIPGGKVKMLETSEEAVKRELEEELGYNNLNFNFLGISEEVIKNKDEKQIQQITMIYQAIYDKEIKDEEFKSIENEWIKFKWINVDELKKIELHPKQLVNMILNSNNHIVEVIGE